MSFNKLGLKPLMSVRALSTVEAVATKKSNRGHKRQCLVDHQARNAALESAAEASKLPWRLMGAT